MWQFLFEKLKNNWEKRGSTWSFDLEIASYQNPNTFQDLLTCSAVPCCNIIQQLWVLSRPLTIQAVTEEVKELKTLTGIFRKNEWGGGKLEMVMPALSQHLAYKPLNPSSLSRWAMLWSCSHGQPLCNTQSNRIMCGYTCWEFLLRNFQGWHHGVVGYSLCLWCLHPKWRLVCLLSTPLLIQLPMYCLESRKEWPKSLGPNNRCKRGR